MNGESQIQLLPVLTMMNKHLESIAKSLQVLADAAIHDRPGAILGVKNIQAKKPGEKP